MNFWLLKTEPDAFSIDDLANADKGQTLWDGVRNYQARNFLTDMALGDLAFIYHSSCKTPAIVGVAKVVTEAQPDPSQFDASSPYYDAKATAEKPRWFCPTFEYVAHCSSPVTLKSIKADEQITDLALKKANRLSVMPVTESEWHYLYKLAGLKHTAKVNTP